METSETLRRFAHDLEERVKELNCLYAISSLTLTPGISLSGIFAGAVRLIPEAWQYPDITCASISYCHDVFSTEGFADTPWKQVSKITIEGKEVGQVTVCYLAERPTIDEGPFLRAERKLIDAIAERLTEAIMHKRAEEAMQASEAKYRGVVEQSHDGISLVDSQGMVVEWNSALERITGISSGKARGQYLWDVYLEIMPEELYSVEDRMAFCDSWLKALKGRNALWFNQLQEMQIRRSDGECRVLQSLSFPVLKGREFSVGSIIRDLTDYRQVQAALRQSEEQVRLLSENVTESVVYRYRLIPEEGFEYVSPSVFSVTGYTAQEFAASIDLFLRNVSEERRLLAEAFMRSPEAVGGPITLYWRRKDGQYVWLEQRQVPIRRKDGSVVAVEGVLSDITARKQAEKALDESERRQAILLQSAPVVLFHKKASGDFDTISVSEKVRSITGFPANRLVGDGHFWFSRVHPEDRQLVKAQYRRAIHLGSSVAFEYRWRCADDSYHRFIDRAVLDTDRDELVVTSMDINSRRGTTSSTLLSRSKNESGDNTATTASGWKRLNVKLPVTESATARRPSCCPQCGSEVFVRHQIISRQLRGREGKVEIVRYRCKDCDHTFSHNPYGVSRSQQSAEALALVAILYGLGLSIGKISYLAGRTGLQLSRASIWRIGKENAESMRISRPSGVNCLLPHEDNPVEDEFVIVDKIGLGDAQSPASIELLLWEEESDLVTWLNKHLSNLGAELTIQAI